MSRGIEPAYPAHGTMGEVIASGLTKRELFAAMAMQGILSLKETEHSCTKFYGVYAKQAVMQADALLAELERTA